MTKTMRLFLILSTFLVIAFCVAYVFVVNRESPVPGKILTTMAPRQAATTAPAGGEPVQLPRQVGPSAASISFAPHKKNFGPEELKALEQLEYRIEYPPGQENLLHPFFSALDALGQQPSVVRVMHYGDSQLEGDRITGTLRNRLQEHFGGCGAGTVPVIDVTGQLASVHIDYSTNWKKYAVYGNMRHGINTSNFGMQGNIFRFENTEGAKPAKTCSAWVRFSKSKQAYPGTCTFNQLKLYYGQPRQPVRLRIASGGRTLYTDSLQTAEGFGMRAWPIDSFNKDITVEMTGASPDIYAMGFDCQSGVMVDNIPMRGSSGVEFTRMNINYLAEQIKALHTRLLILQYGVNVVPNILNDYHFYGKMLYKQLTALKALLPDVDILFIGVSDIAMRQNNHYVSYPNIPKIRDVQREACFKAGCAFYDLYEAMGGPNTITRWVESSPSLAERDYTHFNARGARIVGEMIYNALMHDYLSYKNFSQK